MTGSGTLADPYIIYDVTDLQNVELDTTAYYELANDIDASATIGWNGGAGFLPLGQLTNEFTGQLDGKGHKITSLFVNRPAAGVGLFAYNEGTVQNLGLEDCDITGASAGGLAYENVGTITRCYTTGTVDGGTHGAGLVQRNTGTITHSYSRCSADGTFSGGFVQWNEDTIDDCYSTGTVTGMLKGGFCQFNEGTITNCFWDTETSGLGTSDGGTGKTTAEMKTETTFTDAGWDFTSIWNICAGVNGDYPCLVGVTPGCIYAPVVPFIINKAYALSREQL